MPPLACVVVTPADAAALLSEGGVGLERLSRSGRTAAIRHHNMTECYEEGWASFTSNFDRGASAARRGAARRGSGSSGVAAEIMRSAWRALVREDRPNKGQRRPANPRALAQPEKAQRRAVANRAARRIAGQAGQARVRGRGSCSGYRRIEGAGAVYARSCESMGVAPKGSLIHGGTLRPCRSVPFRPPPTRPDPARTPGTLSADCA